METPEDNEGQIFEVPPEVAVSMILGAPVFCRQPAPGQHPGSYEVCHERQHHINPRDTHHNP